MKFLFLASLLVLPSFALGFEEADEEALAEVQALLKNPQTEQLPVVGNEQQKAALQKLNELSKESPGVTKEINQLSSSVFTDMVKKHGGGEEAIHKALMEAQQDPKKFFQSMSPEQQRKIRELASEIDKKSEQSQKQK
jgi:hypothetical protein